MKNQRSIKLDDFKSIHLMDVGDQKYLSMSMYTDSAYVFIRLTPNQLEELIECLQSFQKEIA